uniref:F-box domain-containing protein n=1 Tax=Acrobeloides nanus TaxID=290746 RepID=A0A914CYJ6_9BILA
MVHIPTEVLLDIFISMGTCANHQFPTEIYAETDLFVEAMKNIRLVSQTWNATILNNITKLPKKKLNECGAQLVSKDNQVYIRISSWRRNKECCQNFQLPELINCYFNNLMMNVESIYYEALKEHYFKYGSVYSSRVNYYMTQAELELFNRAPRILDECVASNYVVIDVKRLNKRSFIKTISANPSIYLSEYAEKIKVKIQFWELDLDEVQATPLYEIKFANIYTQLHTEIPFHPISRKSFQTSEILGQLGKY